MSNRRHPDFDRNVFINCPFDDSYTPIFNAVVFAVHNLGFRPRCALESSNAGQIRLSKIMDIINDCKYSIHDLSRTELDALTGLPRFNMPLELGLDLGCKRFGSRGHKEKISLVMDIESHRYEKFISDIKGQDVYPHGGDVQQVINVVRNWLRYELDYRIVKIPSGQKIFQRYGNFQASLPALCYKLNWNPKQLPFPDFSGAVATWAVATWIEQNPL